MRQGADHGEPPLKKLKCKIGDMVCVSWDDAVSFPRVEAEPREIPVAKYETFGLCGYVDSKKIVILHERQLPYLDQAASPKKLEIEPTALPIGMCTRIIVYKPRK